MLWRGALGPKWRGPHETPKPLKNKYFHEENSRFASLLRNRFSEEILVRKLEASKKPRGQQEARKKPARGKEASKKPARGQEEAPNEGGPTKHRNH